MTKEKLVESKLSEMEPGNHFNVKNFINEHWIYGYNIYARNSFSVMMQRAKNKMPEKLFRTIKGNVTRIK